MKLNKFNCRGCGIKFATYENHKKYCSYDCQNKNRKKLGIKPKKMCSLCNLNIHQHGSKYCSDCSSIKNNLIKKKHLELVRKNSKNRYYKIRDKRWYKDRRRKNYNKYSKENYKNNIRFRLRILLCTRLGQALKRYNSQGKVLSSSKYGINFKDIVEHLNKTLPSDFNEKKYHIDHIKPISLFNLESTDEIKKCFSKENLRWLEAKENIKKGNKYIL